MSKFSIMGQLTPLVLFTYCSLILPALILSSGKFTINNINLYKPFIEFWWTFLFIQLTFDDNLFAALIHTTKGTSCSDGRFQDLSTEGECVDAVNYAKSFNGHAQYVFSGSWEHSPKGCVIYPNNGNMYFNKHTSGSNQVGSRCICYNGKY